MLERNDTEGVGAHRCGVRKDGNETVSSLSSPPSFRLCRKTDREKQIEYRDIHADRSTEG